MVSSKQSENHDQHHPREDSHSLPCHLTTPSPKQFGPGGGAGGQFLAKHCLGVVEGDGVDLLGGGLVVDELELSLVVGAIGCEVHASEGDVAGGIEGGGGEVEASQSDVGGVLHIDHAGDVGVRVLVDDQHPVVRVGVQSVHLDALGCARYHRHHVHLRVVPQGVGRKQQSVVDGTWLEVGSCSEDGLVGRSEGVVEVDGVAGHGGEGHADIQGPQCSCEGVGHPIHSRIIGEADIVDGDRVVGHVDDGIGLIDQSLLEVDG